MKLVKLEDVCYSVASNISQKDVMMLDGSYPIYGASGLIKNINFYKSEKTYIAIVKDGSGVGRTMIMPEKSSVIGTMQYIFPRDNIDIRYLYYAIRAMDLSKYCTGIAIPHIYFKDYKKEKLNLPSISEQVNIANKLDLVQKIIDLKQQQIENLNELIKSQFADMFGDPVKNNKKWNTDAINNVAPIQNYKGTFENKVWLLNLEMVEANSGKIIDYLYEDIDNIGNSTCTFNEENILYSKLRPYLNKVVIPNKKGYATSELVPLKPNKDELNRYFLAYLLRSDQFVQYISEKVAGAKMPRVSMDMFRKFNLILPPLELQKKFADFAIQIDKQKTIIDKSLKETEELQESLMNKYFS